MIEEPTCLILGAGASAHLGFPLGVALKDRMVAELQSEHFADSGASNLGIPSNIICNTDHALMCQQLGFGGWRSPDAFLEKHPEHRTLGKHLIASMLRVHENENALMTERRGWYTQLVDALLAESIDDFRRNQLSIITYNYDRSVDCVIHRLVQHRYGLDSDSAWQLVCDVIPIIHVHGTLGPYPSVPYGLHGRSTEKAADAIKIVSEVQDDTPEFRAATRCLQRANRIIIVGFAFAMQNVERLGFFDDDSIGSRRVMIINGWIGAPPVDAEFVKWIGGWGFKKEHLIDGDANTAFSRYNPFRA
jgi:hypothetical protein